MSQLKITQVRSKIGSTQRHRGTLRSLGLGRIGSTAVHEDSLSLQGALRKVASLVKVEEVDGGR